LLSELNALAMMNIYLGIQHEGCLLKNLGVTTDEWIKIMWYLYTMKFYSAMKKNEILSLANKWMELENIILSEVSQAQKTKNRMFSLICRL
jgi:hypothetical protein